MKILIGKHDAITLVSYGGLEWIKQAEEPVILGSGAKVTASYKKDAWEFYIEGTEEQLRETQEVRGVPTEEAIEAALALTSD